MGAIKDLVDLVTQLTNSVEDRKFAAELRQIQAMIGGIQSEHATIHEQRIELMSENAQLKQENVSLQQEILALQNEINNPKESKSQHKTKLSAEAEKILMVFTKHTEISAVQISNLVSLDLTRTEHWLDTLINAQMITASYSMMSDTTYCIISEGRKYLVDTNMV